MSGRALVVGATGISGGNLTQRLLADGWEVAGLCRRPEGLDERITPLSADLLDAEAVAAAVEGLAPTHVFFTTWSRRPTEAENIDVNGRMLQNLLDATAAEKSVRHVTLVTGLKHYLGPFEAYATVQPDTPFSEDQPRLPYENFYYVQEDILFAASERDGFTWSVHRPHTLIGWALGNAMNMGVTLAVYAAICRETGRGFHFPGSQEQWEAVTDVTDAGLLADHIVWAATTPAAANRALNIVNGDVFRWRRLWPRLAAALAVDAGAVQRGACSARGADGGRRRDLARGRASSRPPGHERRLPCLVVAHGRRSGAHDRDVHRHGAQPAARLRRRARLGILVHRPLRAPSGRADRAMTVAPERGSRMGSA